MKAKRTTRTPRGTAKKARRRGRPAGASSDDLVVTILDTTLSKLGERGYVALSVDEIAKHVGVNKTSIYRRWPTKAELVIAALSATKTDEPPFVETGDLRKDLEAVLAVKAKRLSTAGGRTIARALMSIGDDETMASTLRSNRFSLPTAVIRAAIDRGELPKSTDPTFLAELLLAPILHRAVILGDPIKPAFITNVIDVVLAGASKTKKR